MKKKLELFLLVSSLIVVSAIFIYVKNYSTHNAQAVSATYYVSTGGNDSYPGSIIGPFRTLKKCHDVAVAGDKCVVEGGTYTERLLITRSGITFQGQATKSVVTEGFYITGSNNIVEGFNVFLTNTSTNVLNHTNGINEGGIVVRGNYNIVRNNKIKGATLVGIHIQGNNHLIEGNEISESHSRGQGDADGMRFFGESNTIRNNYIHNLDYDVESKAEHAHIDCFQSWVDSSKGYAMNTLLEGNTCDNSQRFDAELKGQGIMFDGARRVTDPNTGVVTVIKYTAKNITIRNNVIRARQTYILNVDGVKLENNVFELFDIGNGGYYQDDLNLLVKNNIYYLKNSCSDCASVAAPGSTLITSQSGYNWYYRGDNSYTRTDELTFASDTKGVNPLFVDAANGNFHLQTSPTNSPACVGGMSGSYVGAFPCTAPTATGTVTTTPSVTISPTVTSLPTVTFTASATPTITATIIPTATPAPTIPITLQNVYFTFAKFRYNKYVSPVDLMKGDTVYLKNFNPNQLKLLQVFLYDYEKKGNQGYTKSKVTSTSMYLKTNYLLASGKRYAYVMKFQDKATGIIMTKYFVIYTAKMWNGVSKL